MPAPALFTSYVRTVVPIAAGLVLGLAARYGLNLDDTTVVMYVTAALTALYYAAFRGLEVLAARLSWRPLQLAAGVLLGWARPPSYDQSTPSHLQVDPQTLKRITGKGA